MYRYIARVYFRKSTRYCINEFIGVCSVFLLMERHGIPSYICTSYYHGATWYYELVLVLCTCTITNVQVRCVQRVSSSWCAVCVQMRGAHVRALAQMLQISSVLSLFSVLLLLSFVSFCLSLSLLSIFLRTSRGTHT